MLSVQSVIGCRLTFKKNTAGRTAGWIAGQVTAERGGLRVRR